MYTGVSKTVACTPSFENYEYHLLKFDCMICNHLTGANRIGVIVKLHLREQQNIVYHDHVM